MQYGNRNKNGIMENVILIVISDFITIYDCRYLLSLRKTWVKTK